MTALKPSSGDLPIPGVARRLACFLYEGVLLFGVVMATGLFYAIATRQTHGLVGKLGLQVLVFVVLGTYFVHFWTRSGQTLAMQTWHIKLVRADGGPVSRLRATGRFLLAWLWFLPALATLGFSGLRGALPAFAAVLSGVLAYAGLAWLHPQRQFWHDAVCGTCLVTWRPPQRLNP